MKILAAVCYAATLFTLTGCKDKRLVDDLQWIDNTYNPHDGVSGSNGHGKTGWYNHAKGNSDVLASGVIETLKSDGCRFEIRAEDDPSDNVHKEMINSWVYKFNLRDLDPESVKTKSYTHYGGFDCEAFAPGELEAAGNRCDYAEMTVLTRNAQPVVQEDWHSLYPKLTGVDNQSSSSKKATEIWLSIRDLDYAKKFSAVFEDAIKRCGGTKGAAS